MQPRSQPQSTPSATPTHGPGSASPAAAQQRAATSDMHNPHHATSQEPGNAESDTQSHATDLPSTSDQGSSHVASPSPAANSPEGNVQQHHSPAAALPTTSQLQGSMTRPQARYAWPVVNRRRGQESNGILLDNYSAVVSDSDTSEEEAAVQQPVHLLGNINARTIQSGAWLVQWTWI